MPYHFFMALVMACLPRLNLPKVSQHVVQRGNNRQAGFFRSKIIEFI